MKDVMKKTFCCDFLVVVSMFCDVQPKVLANYDFAPENTEELAFRRGDIIYVLNKNDPNWWMGEIVRDNDVSRGLFPKNYVCPYSD